MASRPKCGVACDDANVKRADADRMFHFACVCGGCSNKQAELLYAGVRVGAWAKKIPLWEGAPLTVAPTSPAAGGVPVESLPARSMRTTYEEIAHELQGTRVLSFDELQERVEKHLIDKKQQVSPAQ